MKTSKLVDRIQEIISAPRKDTKLKKLYKTVKALKKKQRRLEAELKETSGKRARQHLRQKIDVLRVQRRKGCKVYRAIKAGRA